MPLLEQSFEVLEQFCQGDLAAFEELFRRHQSEVYRWIVRIVRDPGTAEDLTVETFWRVHRAHARFNPERSFGAWLRRIATNAALDHLRKAKPETSLPDDLQMPAPSTNPGIADEIRRKTAQAFQELPPKLRVAATLALIEEQSYDEIAAALGISTGAVKLRVFRAVRLLRNRLKQQGIEP